MRDLIGIDLTANPAINWIDKIKNICLYFVILLIWTVLAKALLAFVYDATFQVQSDPVDITLDMLFFSLIWAPIWETAVYVLAPMYIARLLDKRFIWPIIIIGSAIFGWGHNHGPVSIMYQGVMGVIFSVVYLKNNNNYASTTILHSMWNIASLLFF